MKKITVSILLVFAGFLTIEFFEFNVAGQQTTPDNFLRRAPDAATVTVSGRITSPNGRAISGARVTAVRSNGDLTYSRSNPFGYYQIRPLESGETYIFQVTHKRYTFQPRILSLTEDVISLDFVAQ